MARQLPLAARQLALALLLVFALVSPFTHATFEEESDHPHRALSSSSIPFSNWSTTKDAIVYGLAFIMVLLAAHPLGVLFPQYLKLPLITGYLIVGIISGPFVANLLPTKLVTMLAPSVNALALSFISFQAGQEIYLPELKPQIKGILQLLLVLYSVTMVILTTALMVINDPFFFDTFDGSCQLAIALMFGSIAVLGSPATVMAIKIELNSVGPFTNLMLGATMTAEFVVLISFSISRVVSSIYCAKLDISVGNLLFTMGIVFSNLLVGAIIALFIIAIFSIPGGPEHDECSAQLLVHQDTASFHGSAPTSTAHYLTRSNTTSFRSLRSFEMQSIVEDDKAEKRRDLERGLSSAFDDPDNQPHPHNAYVESTDGDDVSLRVKQSRLSRFLTMWHWRVWYGSLYLKGFLWLVIGFAFYISTNTISEATIAEYGHSWDVKLEPLLVLMTASCLAGHYGAIRHDMHVILDTAAPYIFLPFFVMTGAALKLDQVADAIPLMSLYVILRFVSIFIACYVGGRWILKLPPHQYNNLWLTMTPQAGVALGLANEVKGLSDEPWAAEFAATIVAAVVVNQILGPVLCAMGLIHAGESQHAPLKPAGADGGQQQQQSQQQGGGKAGEIELTNGPRDPRPLLPFYKVQNAVVIGEDETAFEIALELSLYGAHVNVPLLDEELATKWHQINETILARSAKGELIKFKNKLQDPTRHPTAELHGMAAATDVVIFTGNPERTIEHVKTMQATLGGRNECPRFIAIIRDCTHAKALKDLGVLIIQPSIAMANIATRMALLDLELAEQLSNEISTTSNFSTAAFFLRHEDSDRGSIHSLSEMRLGGRRLALGRSVVNHHNVNYEKVADALSAVNLPLPPPPPRVSMFGTTAPGHDPFKRGNGVSAYEYYVVDDPEALETAGVTAPPQVFEEQFMSPRDAGPTHPQGPLHRRSRSQRLSFSRGASARRSRHDSVGSYSAYAQPLLRRNSSAAV